MQIFLWLLGFFFLSLLDVPRIWKQRNIRELCIVGGFLTVGVVYGILFQLDVTLPDPNTLERMLFEPFGKLIMKPVG